MITNKMGRRGFLGTAAAGLFSGINITKHKHHRLIASFDCDVTPPLGTPIYSSFQPLSVIEQPLQAKGVILEDKGGRYVLCAVDYCELCNNTYTRWRATIAEAAGTTPSNVMVQTVHQHTAPMLDEDSYRYLDGQTTPSVHPSLESINIPMARLAESVRQAAGRLQPYNQIGTGHAKAERVASNRRVPMDGTILTRYSSCRDPKLVDAPEGLIDPYVRTITFANDDAPIVRLHYYATHPQSFYGDPRASIDFAGMARERLQQQEGVFQVYFNGCGGNITAGKYNPGTPESRQGLSERLGAAMKAAADSTRYASAKGKLVVRTAPLLLVPRSDGPWSEEALAAQMAKADANPNNRSIAAMFKAFKDRASTPIEVSSFEIGDVLIVSLPGECAVEYQLSAQELRPDRFVAVAGYGDCGPAYINLDKFASEGGYEPSAAHAVVGSEKTVRYAINTVLDL